LKEIEVPQLTWEERYRRMVELFYAGVFGADEEMEVQFNHDKASEVRGIIHRNLGKDVGARLVKKYNLEPTVEGALKLLKLYVCEIYGYGAKEYVSTKLESSDRGVLTIIACRGWVIQERAGNKELMKKMDCTVMSGEEFTGLIKALNTDFKLKVTKAFPRGDDRCEFIIEN